MFWLYMLIMTMLLPAVMLVFGRKFMDSAPKQINVLFGYRTSRSMKNRETWAFAHRCCGIYWWKTGWIALAVSAMIMLFFIRSSMDTIAKVGTLVVLLQLVPMCGVLPVTERALKHEFDKNGCRIPKNEV